MANNILGFIGGSGLYDLNFVKNKKLLEVKSLWGEPSDNIIEGYIGKNKIYFLSRHGKGHKHSPSGINYLANIDCLKKCGVTDLISISAVGSLKKELSPGTFVLVNQFIDKTYARQKSFFNEGIIAHVPMAKPASEILINLASKVLNNLKIRNKKNGTYLAIEGPQFSTKSESELFRSWNVDVIGMTNMPEAKLVREAEIRYCSVSMVTDYDCWYDEEESVDVEMLIKNLNKNAKNALEFIKNFSINYYKGINFKNDTTSNILDSSIVTNKKYWSNKYKRKLKTILKRYIKDNK